MLRVNQYILMNVFVSRLQVEEAVAVLQAHQAKENAATQSASAAMKKD